VGLIGEGADTASVAAATMEAAQQGLRDAARDPGLVDAILLLAQIPLAARTQDFAGALRALGMEVPDTPKLLDVVGAFNAHLDATLARGGRSDLGEVAQMAASETLTVLGTERARGLFGTTPEDVRRSLAAFATTKQFGSLARDFFSRLTRKYLASFLSRELSNHVGPQGRFPNVDAHTAYNDALQLHCQQAAAIVEAYAGGWFSKGNFEGGIDARKASDFASYSLTKIRAELAQGAKPGDR
jgi:hypothetical protein